METHRPEHMIPPRTPRYFYGWKIVAASFMAGLAYAEHFASVLGIFIRPLQSEFGWSRSVIAGVHTIGRVIEASIAPIVGPMIDRYGPRVLMPIGALIVGLAMLGVTQVNTIWQFLFLRGVLVAVGFTLMGYLVTDVTISKWFIRKRGRAIAVSKVSHSLSNIIMTPVTVFVISASGWRTMFVVFAVVTWVVVLIPSAVLMRRSPEDLGLHPDGIDPGTVENPGQQQESEIDKTASAPEPIWSRREVLRTRTFWLLTICFAANSISFQGINLSLAPYIQDLGYKDTMLAAVITFRSVLIVTGTLLMGFLADRAHKTAIRVMPFMIQALGVFFFLLAQNPVFLWLGVALYGFGSAGIHVTQEVVWADYFGRPSLGLVRSLAFSISFGFGAAGPVVMNAVFDIFGSYELAFFTIVGALCVAAILIGIAQPVKATRYATGDDVAPSNASHNRVCR